VFFLILPTALNSGDTWFTAGSAWRCVKELKGEEMAVVPLNRMESEAKNNRRIFESESTNWARYAAAGSLVAGGILLITGNRRAGLVTAASGAALALLDQQEAVKEWWNALPGYIENVQYVLGQVEQTVAEVASQRERLHRILTR
jgi:hypothetical protein